MDKKITLISLTTESIKSWGNLFRGIVLIGAIFLGIGILIRWSLDVVRPAGLKLTTVGGTTIQFGKSGRFETILVHPRGWQETEIRISEGQEITVSASGSINIALGRMIEALNYQYDIKARNEKKYGDRSYSRFTEEEKINSTIAFPWIRPTGLIITDVLNESALKSIVAFQNKRIVPEAKVGQLVAVISPPLKGQDKIPNIKECQVEPISGKNHKFISDHSGFLWFIVNDLWEEDGYSYLLVWQDNLGFFEVKIRID